MQENFVIHFILLFIFVQAVTYMLSIQYSENFLK